MVMITNLNIKISLKQSDYYSKVIGEAKPASLPQKWKSDGQSQIEFTLTLDLFLLSEKLRQGGNLNLFAPLAIHAYPVDSPSEIESYPIL